eukprot:4941314-Amphidinium_carterae.1
MVWLSLHILPLCQCDQEKTVQLEQILHTIVSESCSERRPWQHCPGTRGTCRPQPALPLRVSTEQALPSRGFVVLGEWLLPGNGFAGWDCKALGSTKAYLGADP